MTGRKWTVLFVLLFLSLSCKGELQTTNNGSGTGTGIDDPDRNANNANVEVNPDVLGVGVAGIRRLSQQEYDNTLRDLLYDDTDSGQVLLPEDTVDPFDNDYSTQRVSQALVDALESLSIDAAARAMDDPTRRDKIVGCTPSGPDDEACFRSFVEDFGRRALRRSLAPSEVDRFMPLLEYSIEADDFYAGVEFAIQAFLQMPGFVYHMEIGVPVDDRDGLYRLNQWEMASRLSYFLWGTMPDDQLLDKAEAGELATSEQIRAEAERMLADPKARERVHRFHAMWLGYHRFDVQGGIGDAMEAETEALIDRVVFEEKRDYFDLFTIQETFANDELANHYGLTPPDSTAGQWIDYEGKRGGIFSHATFLSVVSKFGDTSPTQRGKLIRERLMCQKINPPPPDQMVDVDQQPEAEDSPCKKDAYAQILEAPGCAGCHTQMDPVGFGLENFDQAGQYREHDEGYPECTISGEGELVGVGNFNGPRELGEMLVDSGELESCVVKQVYRFAMGHREGSRDEQTLQELAASFAESGHRFDQLILDLVSHEAFLYRQAPEATD